MRQYSGAALIIGSSDWVSHLLTPPHSKPYACVAQSNWNIQMTVLIEENKCSHMAALAMLSSASGGVPKWPRPIWSWLNGDQEPTNTLAETLAAFNAPRLES